MCIGLSTAFGACSDASRRAVEDILSRTVPPGDTVPTLSEIARARQSDEFTWEFVTHLNPNDYVDGSNRGYGTSKSSKKTEPTCTSEN